MVRTTDMVIQSMTMKHMVERTTVIIPPNAGLKEVSNERRNPVLKKVRSSDMFKYGLRM